MFKKVLHVSFSDVADAAERIKPYIRRTPMMRANRLPGEALDEIELFFKLEVLQVTGSFKARGAINKMLLLPEESRKKGLVTASGGNHGKAVAYAARLIGVPSQIYIPISTPQDKEQAIREMGAELSRQGNVLDESSTIALESAKAAKKCYIHNFNDPAVIAGNGTQGLEILEDLPDVDTILVATGGGGMLAGILLAVKEKRPDIKVVGIEPEGAATIKSALAAGKVVKLDRVNTQAGTLALAATAEINFQIIKDRVDDMLLVSDDEMLAASRWLWQQFSIAAELSASAGIAALLTGKYAPAKGEKVCVILCGAGADGIRK